MTDEVPRRAAAGRRCGDVGADHDLPRGADSLG
jgi:hypothetical protein